MSRFSHWAWLGLLLSSTACNDRSAGSKTSRSDRERDSILGASQLPGAAGVRGALRAQDSAAAQNARLDSVGRQP